MKRLIIALLLVALMIFLSNIIYTHKNMKQISKELIEFVKLKEGYKATAYKDGSHNSIGYGHQVHNYISCIYMRISEEQASYLLEEDLKKVINDLNRVYPAFSKLDQGKRDALTSLVYNWGIGNFAKSKLFKYLKEHNYKNASHEFLDIVKSKGKVMGGLVKRRQKEADIFLHGW